MANLLHPELSYKLYGIFYEVHNRLGRFLSHKQYCDAIEMLFKKYGIKYKREVEIPINFEWGQLKGNVLDFDVEDTIPIDIKTEKYITKKDYQQMQRYLKAKNRILGIIVNFREKSLRPRRVINSKGRV
jgi:GxxExxY protein